MSTSVDVAGPDGRRQARTSALVAAGILVVVAATGLTWAKWLPYAQRAGAVAASGS